MGTVSTVGATLMLKGTERNLRDTPGEACFLFFPFTLIFEKT